MQYSREKLEARFWELEAAKEKLEADLAPLKAKRDAIMAKIGPELAEANALGKQIKEAETKAGLVDIDQERAFLSRGLGGKVGTRPAS